MNWRMRDRPAQRYRGDRVDLGPTGWNLHMIEEGGNIKY